MISDVFVKPQRSRISRLPMRNKWICLCEVFLIYAKILVKHFLLFIDWRFHQCFYYLYFHLHVERQPIKVCILYNFRTHCPLCVLLPFTTDHQWVSDTESKPKFRWHSLFSKVYNSLINGRRGGIDFPFSRDALGFECFSKTRQTIRHFS